MVSHLGVRLGKLGNFYFWIRLFGAILIPICFSDSNLHLRKLLMQLVGAIGGIRSTS